MKKKQVLAVSCALMIGTTTALTGVPASVMAQENTEVMKEAVVEENKTEQVPVEQEAEKIPATIEKETIIEAKTVEKSTNTEVKAGNIAVDETHFPDAEFRRYIEDKMDKNKDKVLSSDEINQVTLITHLESYNIRDFRGIEFFTSLQTLTIDDLKISNLETINNSNLRTLNCFDCSELKTINVNNLPHLEKLSFLGCEKVENLILTKCVNLKKLSVKWTNISNIDLTQNSKLEELDITGTPMTQIDLTQNVALRKISCSANNLESLDVSNNLELEEIFWVGSTTIKGIDVTKNTKLKKLTCSAVFWADLGNNPNLTFNTYHYRSLDISLAGNTFDFKKEVDKGIDISKVTITSNGTLDKKTGIVTVDDVTKPVIYEYDCGFSNQGNETLTVTININKNVNNTLPTISANDITLHVGDTFDPLEKVTATDKEDGTITLTKDNIIANDVDTSKTGTYHVTYKVTDKNGASIEKTITVTVKEKTTNKPVSLQQPQKPNKPTTPTEPSGEKNPVKTGDMTNIGLFVSMFAGSTGTLAVLFGKKRKRNEND